MRSVRVRGFGCAIEASVVSRGPADWAGSHADPARPVTCRPVVVSHRAPDSAGRADADSSAVAAAGTATGAAATAADTSNSAAAAATRARASLPGLRNRAVWGAVVEHHG